MVRPGPLSPADAAYINDQLRELEVLKRRVESMLGQAPELIPAAITSMTTVSWTTVVTGTTVTTLSAVQHGWHEQGHNVQGARVTLIGGRTGTNLVDPARLPNGLTLATTITSSVPVWLRKVALAATHGIIHEVISSAGSASGTSSGGFEFVETVTVSFSSGNPTSSPYSDLNRTLFDNLMANSDHMILGNLEISVVTNTGGVDISVEIDIQDGSGVNIDGGDSYSEYIQQRSGATIRNCTFTLAGYHQADSTGTDTIIMDTQASLSSGTFFSISVAGKLHLWRKPVA